MGQSATAPAAHMVTVQPTEGGVLVGHLREDGQPDNGDPTCGAPAVFVPCRSGQPWLLSIDMIQAVLSHRCPGG